MASSRRYLAEAVKSPLVDITGSAVRRRRDDPQLVPRRAVFSAPTEGYAG